MLMARLLALLSVIMKTIWECGFLQKSPQHSFKCLNKLTLRGMSLFTTPASASIYSYPRTNPFEMYICQRLLLCRTDRRQTPGPSLTFWAVVPNGLRTRCQHSSALEIFIPESSASFYAALFLLSSCLPWSQIHSAVGDEFAADFTILSRSLELYRCQVSNVNGDVTIFGDPLLYLYSLFQQPIVMDDVHRYNTLFV
jgi:hypothetical protein